MMEYFVGFGIGFLVGRYFEIENIRTMKKFDRNVNLEGVKKQKMFKDDTSRVFNIEKEAKAAKKRGDKIFYDPSSDKYYVVTPKRHKFWGT